jgi:hypothetical protein
VAGSGRHADPHALPAADTRRSQLKIAREASSGRSAKTVYGGHEHVLRQTLIALAAGHRLDEHDNPGEATVHVLHGTPSSATAVSTRLRGMVESRWVQQQLGRPVIKAFNNIYADHLRDNGRPAGTSGRIALPVAGDDESAKAVVMQLIDDLGFDAVDAGSLDQSWRQQPGTPVYTTDLDADGVRRALSEASPSAHHSGAPRPTAPAVSSTHGNAQPRAAHRCVTTGQAWAWATPRVADPILGRANPHHRRRGRYRSTRPGTPSPASKPPLVACPHVSACPRSVGPHWP